MLRYIFGYLLNSIQPSRHESSIEHIFDAISNIREKSSSSHKTWFVQTTPYWNGSSLVGLFQTYDFCK